MRFNYKNYSVLPHVEGTKDIYTMQVDEALGNTLSLEEFTNLLKSVKEINNQVKHRFVVSDTFTKALELAYPKIQKEGKYLENYPGCGMLFLKGGLTMYLSNPQDSEVKLYLLGFSKEALTSFVVLSHDGNIAGRYIKKDGSNCIESMVDWVHSTLALLYFVKNCEIETKELKAGKKVKANNVKYLNETNKDFTVLDCTWFTELVTNIPMQVSGHLRWQPCGEKHLKRKLIWIDSYEKRYVRHAKKETYTL